MKNSQQNIAANKTELASHLRYFIIALIIGIVISVLWLYRHWGRYWMDYTNDRSSRTFLYVYLPTYSYSFYSDGCVTRWLDSQASDYDNVDDYYDEVSMDMPRLEATEYLALRQLVDKIPYAPTNTDNEEYPKIFVDQFGWTQDDGRYFPVALKSDNQPTLLALREYLREYDAWYHYWDQRPGETGQWQYSDGVLEVTFDDENDSDLIAIPDTAARKYLAKIALDEQNEPQVAEYNEPQVIDEVPSIIQDDAITNVPPVMLEIAQTQDFIFQNESRGFAPWYRHESEYQDANVPFAIPYNGKNMIVKNNMNANSCQQALVEVEKILKNSGYQRDSERIGLTYRSLADIWTNGDDVLEIIHCILDDEEDVYNQMSISYLGKIADISQVEKEQSLALQTIAKYNRGELGNKGFISGRYLEAIEDFTNITNDLSGKHHIWVIIRSEDPQYMYYTINEYDEVNIIDTGSVFDFDSSSTSVAAQKLRSIINCDLLNTHADNFPSLKDLLDKINMCSNHGLANRIMKELQGMYDIDYDDGFVINYISDQPVLIIDNIPRYIAHFSYYGENHKVYENSENNFIYFSINQDGTINRLSTTSSDEPKLSQKDRDFISQCTYEEKVRISDGGHYTKILSAQEMASCVENYRENNWL